LCVVSGFSPDHDGPPEGGHHGQAKRSGHPKRQSQRRSLQLQHHVAGNRIESSMRRRTPCGMDSVLQFSHAMVSLTQVFLTKCDICLAGGSSRTCLELRAYATDLRSLTRIVIRLVNRPGGRVSRRAGARCRAAIDVIAPQAAGARNRFLEPIA